MALTVVIFIAFSTVQAATISVDTTTDIDGDDGNCTLREAIVSINNGSIASTGCTVASGTIGVNDTITFAPSLSTQTIGISQSNALSITKDVVISGPGENLLTIDGTGNGSVFDISNSTVELNGLTISGGSTSGDGGGISASGSIVSLTYSTVSNNSANRGGGIFCTNTSSVDLINSTLSENSAIIGGGGIFVNKSSNVSVTRSTVSVNSALGDGILGGDGGGVFASDGIVNFANSTVSGNSAADDGGGISAEKGSIYILINSTLSGNAAVAFGGGFFINGTSSVSLSNSIVSGNSFTSMTGGAAEIRNISSVPVAADSTNLLGDSSLTNAQAFMGFAPNLMGTDIVATSDGNQPVSLASVLSPLADNGGPTQTHALLGGSVAIDAGDDAVCASAPVSSLDQRGTPRPQGAHCDIGAFELIPPSLTIMKAVNNDNGGVEGPADFTLHLSGTGIDGSADRTSGDTIVVETDTAYTVSEGPFPGYSQTGIVCLDDDSSDDLGHPVTLNEGQSATCTISNDDDPPGLKIIKEVIGGSAVPGDFTLHITGGIYDGSVERFSGDIIDVPAEVAYTLSEDPFGGYTQSGVVCVDSSTGEDLGHPVTLTTLGQSATCTISNTYNAYNTFFVIPLRNGGASVFAL